jgi:hypothetical protein
MPADPPSWDIPDLDEPAVRPTENDQAGSGAQGRAAPSAVFDDDDPFGEQGEAMQLELGSQPPPAEPPPPQQVVPATVQDISSPPAGPGGAQSPSEPAEEAQASGSEAVDPPGPGLAVLVERRLDSWADRLLPEPVRDRFVDGGLIGLFSGILLIVSSILASAGSCTYVAATGERLNTGWLAGLLLLLGVGLVVRSWVRGAGS